MDPLRLGICCSSRNAPLASELAARLERNLGIVILIVSEDTALAAETWEQASASSAVLILLDATNARGPVRREVWQSLLEHNGEPPVAITRLEPCQYPKLLERGRFHAMEDPLAMARWVERWVISELLPVATASAFPIAGLPGVSLPSELWTHLVDQPGAISASDLDTAQAFAHQAAAHFDGVCWLVCEDTPPDALTAEIEHKGERGMRLLFILAGAEGGAVTAGLKQSRHSFVIVPPSTADAVLSDHPAAAWLGACPQAGFPKLLLERMAGELGDWADLTIPLTPDRSWIRPAYRFSSTDATRARCVQVLQEVFAFRRRWSGLCRDLAGTCATALRAPFSDELCLDLALFLLDEGRRAEAVAWLQILKGHASNDHWQRRAVEELRWLVDDAGDLIPSLLLPGDQLDFGFPGFAGPLAEERADQALLDELLAAEGTARPPQPIRVKQLRLPMDS